MARAKKESARTGETLTAMIERGLRLLLANPHQSHPREIIRIPVSRATGGLRTGVNLDDSAATLDIMEDRE